VRHISGILLPPRGYDPGNDMAAAGERNHLARLNLLPNGAPVPRYLLRRHPDRLHGVYSTLDGGRYKVGQIMYIG
jgi:hypothetical protein